MTNNTPAVAAAIEDLLSRPMTGDEPVKVVSVRTTVVLRRGDRVWTYEAGADGIPVLQRTGQKDGGQAMVRPPRFDT